MADTHKAIREQDYEDADLFRWLLRQPAVKAQAYFWNHSSRTERKKAIRRDMTAATTAAREDGND